MAESHGALHEMRVLDLTHAIAGPFATAVLADMGADVVKIERPAGDPLRREYHPGFRPFGAVNRNKRCIAVDFFDDRGASVVRRLAAEADALVVNYRLTALERVGLGFDDLADVNPALVYCAITGFGATGPYAGRPGYDLVAQGLSGLMSFTGEPDGPPTKVGVSIADLSAGVFAATAIAAAYAHRLRTGQGQFVDVSLHEAALSYTVWEAGIFFGSGEVATALGSAHRLTAPYQALRTGDGWIIVCAATERMWRELCDVLGCPELVADSRFADRASRLDHRRALASHLETRLRERTTAEWLDLLTAADVPCGPVNDIGEALNDPHVQTRGFVTQFCGPDGPHRYLGCPVRMSTTPTGVDRPVASLGEHTEEVLTQAGFDRGEIDALRIEGLVAKG